MDGRHSEIRMEIAHPFAAQAFPSSSCPRAGRRPRRAQVGACGRNSCFVRRGAGAPTPQAQCCRTPHSTNPQSEAFGIQLPMSSDLSNRNGGDGAHGGRGRSKGDRNHRRCRGARPHKDGPAEQPVIPVRWGSDGLFDISGTRRRACRASQEPPGLDRAGRRAGGGGKGGREKKPMP